MAMTENQLTPKNDPIGTEAPEADWATLFARAIDDIAHIVQSEARLLTVGMRTVLAEQVDRIFTLVAIGALLAVGAVCLVAAAILLLHEFFLLPWWQSFGLTAGALFAVGIAIAAFATIRRKHTKSDPTSSIAI
jgi:Putative Actinobacterial Holin-X, holin superfamily III